MACQSAISNMFKNISQAKARAFGVLPKVVVMILAYLGQTPEVPRTDLRAKHHL
jgi:hypothetical protein